MKPCNNLYSTCKHYAEKAESPKGTRIGYCHSLWEDREKARARGSETAKQFSYNVMRQSRLTIFFLKHPKNHCPREQTYVFSVVK